MVVMKSTKLRPVVATATANQLDGGNGGDELEMKSAEGATE